MRDVLWLLQRGENVPPTHDWLSAREAAVLGGLHVPRRRADWLLGRWTAKRALAALLAAPADARVLARLEVLAADDGAPEAWREGRRLPFALSLSHRGGLGLCALFEEPRELGCDVERVEPRSAAFVRDYFTAAERAKVATARDPELVTALLWSAKESVLKARRTGLRADTRDVEVELGDPGAGQEWCAFEARHGPGVAVLSGWWRRCGADVLTVVADRRIGLPVEIVPLSCVA